MNRILSLVLAAVLGAVVMALFGTIGVTVGHGSSENNFPSMVAAAPTPNQSPTPSPSASMGYPIGAIAVLDAASACWDYVAGYRCHSMGVTAVRLPLGSQNPSQRDALAALMAQLASSASKYQMLAYTKENILVMMGTQTNQTPGPTALFSDRSSTQSFVQGAYANPKKVETLVLLLSTPQIH